MQSNETTAKQELKLESTHAVNRLVDVRQTDMGNSERGTRNEPTWLIAGAGLDAEATAVSGLHLSLWSCMVGQAVDAHSTRKNPDSKSEQI